MPPGERLAWLVPIVAVMYVVGSVILWTAFERAIRDWRRGESDYPLWVDDCLPVPYTPQSEHNRSRWDRRSTDGV